MCLTKTQSEYQQQGCISIYMYVTFHKLNIAVVNEQSTEVCNMSRNLSVYYNICQGYTIYIDQIYIYRQQYGEQPAGIARGLYTNIQAVHKQKSVDGDGLVVWKEVDTLIF
jgi:hypothetical protein